MADIKTVYRGVRTDGMEPRTHHRRTSRAQAPAIVHPILWVSQCIPCGSQKVLWSISVALSEDVQRMGVDDVSEGLDITMGISVKTGQEKGKVRRDDGERLGGREGLL
jgi:hypothetical protein